MTPVKQLVDKLNTYRDAYYNENKSLISDREFDTLYDQLEELEKETGIIYANSPTQTPGYTAVSALEKVTHNHPLLSLAKTKDLDEFINYFEGRPVVVMAKLDGLTASLKYENGKLVSAETRGNGVVGELITHNAKTFTNIPLTINYKGTLIVDGECIITQDTFEEINAREHTEYKNPRNLVSGTVRQLDSHICANRKVRFVAWKLWLAENDNLREEIPYFSLRLIWLSDLGFEIVKFRHVDRHPRYKIDWRTSILAIQDGAKEQGYPIDGCVATFMDANYGDSLGSTEHHNKSSYAYKFYNEEHETTLRDIEWNTTRTGAVNPVAIFDPVDIDGSTISRASLHNVSAIQELEIGIGDTIGIIKANEVIPKVESNYTRSNSYKLPDRCPACGYPLIVKADNGRKTLVCRNEKCSAKLLDKMANFVSRKGMDIRGLSEDRLKVLIEKEYIAEFVDFYILYQYRYELEQLPRWGDKLVNNILDEINKSKKQSLDKVLVAIGLPNVGVATAKTIAKFMNDHHVENENTLFDEFFECCVQGQDWSKLDDIGATTSKAINRYVSDNYSELWKLSLELTPPVEISDIEEQKSLDGKIFCITGTLDLFSNRNALVADIESRGGKVVGSVSKNTNYLICNDKNSGSSKTKKVNKFGVPIISEQEYVEIMCKDGKFNR